jgi:hypothetical protein
MWGKRKGGRSACGWAEARVLPRTVARYQPQRRHLRSVTPAEMHAEWGVEDGPGRASRCSRVCGLIRTTQGR